MSEKPDTASQLLEVIDNILTASLREVRRARAAGPVPATRRRASDKSKSNTELCLDVLIEAGRPAHVSLLVEALERRGVRTSRDSLVSALSKRLAPRGPFLRTAGNTFGLAGRDQPSTEVD